MERGRFVRDFASGDWTMTELCEHYGVSRPTGYKSVERHADKGADGLEDLSRRPLRCPYQTASATEELVVLLKNTHG